MIDETGNDQTVNAQTGKEDRVGFCQDCGRPLTRETVRTVGSGVFCEPCLEVRLGTAVPPYGAVPPNAAGSTAPPPQTGLPPIGGSDPSPVLAALLGLIPGVGAMYNGQFAKGIAHIVIFALLQSMAHVSDVFGILVAGWVFYQAFEAYHTAKARREGLPLPDPFGLNNIADQVGVHFRGTGPGAPPNATNSSGYPGWTGYVPPQTIVTPPPAAETVPPVWGSVPVTPPVEPYTQSAPYTPPASGWWKPTEVPPAGQEWVNTPGNYPVPPVRRSNVPGAAAWLIGLGVIFLLMNLLPEWRLSVGKVFPFLLMVFAGWVFVRRMTFSGGLSPAEGENDAYAQRLVCWLRVPVVLFTVGVLWALQQFEVVRFGRTWPVLVIVVGVVMLLERSVGTRAVPVVDPNPANVDGKGI